MQNDYRENTNETNLISEADYIRKQFSSNSTNLIKKLQILVEGVKYRKKILFFSQRQIECFVENKLLHYAFCCNKAYKSLVSD